MLDALPGCALKSFALLMAFHATTWSFTPLAAPRAPLNPVIFALLRIGTAFAITKRKWSPGAVCSTPVDRSGARDYCGLAVDSALSECSYGGTLRPGSG